jgi:hypothetical protein
MARLLLWQQPFAKKPIHTTLARSEGRGLATDEMLLAIQLAIK